MNDAIVCPSDSEALRKVHSVRPTLCDHRQARDVPGIDPNVLLHAGPAFSSPSNIPKPILNSAGAALVFEGVATDFSEARKQILSGEVVLKPAQDHAVVVPLAGVVSSSMWLHEIVDAAGRAPAAYAPLNGGSGPAMRLGQFSDDVISHFRWLNGEFMDAIASVHSQDIDLIPIGVRALQSGDDCHGRTIAGTGYLLGEWRPQIESYPTVHEFLRQSPMFFLNLWMAACKCMLSGGADTQDSSLITAAGANGVEFGFQIAGIAGKWFVGSSAPPSGDIGEYAPDRALGAIGDSAIVDAAGFGAMALSYAPDQQKAFEGFVPDDAFELPGLLLPKVHSGFTDLGIRVGMSARAVQATRRTPVVALGILDRDGIAGRLGGGIFRYPPDVFDTISKHLD
ncbi:MAG: DUF1116 domain-containing protein [Acidiferrobacterales bacterium]|nr:DUF1116 domain-containing protein [Acidiferrobacterales bacterium]